MDHSEVDRVESKMSSGMKVLLLNIDSKLPNIALKRIEAYHQAQGNKVLWDMPIEISGVDKVYASCIFTKNRPILENYVGLRPDIIAGGTGWDMNVKLPSQIEETALRINYGFTTRGCIRHCPFCMVPQSEGYIRAVGDLYDIWDGTSSSVTLLDNNILALPKHFREICKQLRKENVQVDFNQGLDIRLLTPEVCELLSSIRLKEIRFAFDDPDLESLVRQKVALIDTYNLRHYYFFYVLVGYNTTFEQDIHRCNVLKELGCRPYVMRYASVAKDHNYSLLAQWANQIWTLAKYDFDEFCMRRYGETVAHSC